MDMMMPLFKRRSEPLKWNSSGIILGSVSPKGPFAMYRKYVLNCMYVYGFLVFLLAMSVLYNLAMYIRQPTAETLGAGLELNLLVPERGTEYLTEPDLSAGTQASFVVYIQSAPKHRELRQRIRDTWGNSAHYPDFSFSLIFALGRQSDKDDSLLEEIQTHRDILFLNMDDKYDSLTIKGLLTMRWIAQKFPNTQYILKTDDDVILNLFAWRAIMDTLETKQVTCTTIGFVWRFSFPERWGKYQTSFTEYPYMMFPAFCSGSGYLMTRPAMLDVLKASEVIPLKTRDDPYYTGILTNVMGVPLMTTPDESYKIHGETLDTSRVEEPLLAVHNPGSRWTDCWDHIQDTHSAGRQSFNIRTLMNWEQGFRFRPLADITERHCKSVFRRYEDFRVTF